jgi:flagella basal body P-ring formation protein FlgA
MIKPKHRRLFGQNNRNARHFYSLSAVRDESLRTRVKIFAAGLMALFFVAPSTNAEDLEFQIEQHVRGELDTAFPKLAQDDVTFQINYPANLIAEKACSERLVYNWRGRIKAGANTLHVNCSVPAWQAYLPITVQAFQTVVVANEALSRANTVEPYQLSFKRVDIGTLRMGYFTDSDALAGYELQRTVRSGQVITPYMVEAPKVVNRGDWVTIISGKGLLTVTTTGEALKDGSVGDQIPIKNLHTDQKLRAWILRKGVVTTKKDLL